MQESPQPLRAKVMAIHEVLARASIPHAFGGAIAFGFVGVPRATLDIDLDVFLTVERADEVLALLAQLGVEADPAHPFSRLLREGQTRLLWESTPVDLFFVIHEFYATVEQRVQTYSSNVGAQ